MSKKLTFLLRTVTISPKELMGFDRTLTLPEYFDFYKHNYGKWEADHLKSGGKQEEL